MNKPVSSLRVGLPRSELRTQVAPFLAMTMETCLSEATQLQELAQSPLTLVVVKSEHTHHDISLCDVLIQCDDTVHLQQCENVQEGIALVMANPAAILFVDIELAGQLPSNLAKSVPTVVSGNDCQDALNAFSFNAKGFLLRPYQFLQVENAVVHLFKQVRQEAERHQFERVCDQLSAQHGVPLPALAASLRRQCKPTQSYEQVTIRCGNTWLCMPPQAIKWIEAAGDYMCVHTNDETHIVRSTLIELLKRLPKDRFIRINRSLVVNLDRVKQVVSTAGAIHYVEMDDSTKLKISRRYYTAYWGAYKRQQLE